MRACTYILVALCSLSAGFVPLFGRAENATLALGEEAAMRAAVEAVADSVVQVRTLGGLDTMAGAVRADGPTTGLVISADGYIVSSAFNFAERPASILVTFASGSQAPAELVATDHSRMLVLLKVNVADDLPVPALVPPEEIRVGAWAVAVGRTFRADRTNVSVGIISATDRMFGKVFQTDAAISAANYGGPIIDIRGRVLGLIVPIAPQGSGQVAGIELYDSGVGFAVPLAAIADRLEQMKSGEDQHAGLLGISLDGKRRHVSPARVAAVRPNSPAGKAGLRKGDRIVEVDGGKIRTETDLKFALGPRYGGESVRVVAMRGNERIEQTIELVGKLEVFRHAFLGILPMRLDVARADSREPHRAELPREANGRAESSAPRSSSLVPDGVVVRMVYAGSPAAEAGIMPGDRLVQINDAPIALIRDAIAEMNTLAPGDRVSVRVLRNERQFDRSLTADALPTSVPSELPPAYPVAGQPPRPPAEAHELKLPEFEQTCEVYVPSSHEAGLAQGVLLWLHGPGEADPDEVIRHWRSTCDRDRLILVVPKAADDRGWQRTELEYLRRLTERVIGSYSVDPRRVVVYGEAGGGAMAYLLALVSRDVFTGVATSSAALPRQIRVSENDPVARLAVFAALAPRGESAVLAARSVKQLADAGYPVTMVSLSDDGSGLSADQRETLARWIDILDRF